MRTQTVLAGALALLALVGSPRAQTTNGTVNFCNNGSNLVVLLQSNAPVTVANGIQAGLYWAPVGSSNFVMLGAAAPVGVPLPGIFAGGTRVAGPGTAGGATGQFQVRAWGGGYSSYEQAITNGGYASGVSTIITMPTGNPTNAAPLPPASLVAGGFQGFGLGQSPIIVVPPTNQYVGIGHTAVFTVTAIGAAPLSYQWQFNGANLTDDTRISGSLTPALTIPNVGTNDVGAYRVIVTNVYGMAVSSNATLALVQACAIPPAGLVSWWRAEGNGRDSAGTNDGTLVNGAAYASGMVGQAFSFDGSSGYFAIPASASLAVGASGGMTIEGWINPTDVVTNHALAEWNTGTLLGAHFWISVLSPYGAGAGCIYINLIDTSGGYHWLTSAAGFVQANRFQHVAMTYDKASGVAALYYNGQVVASQSLGTFVPQTTYNLYLGRRFSANPLASYGGAMDEVTVYRRALAAAEILDIFNAANNGKCLTSPPIITVPPTNQIVVRGSNAVFAVWAAGSPVLGYQWQFNGSNTLSASDFSLTIASAQLTNAGSYQVIVTNAYGSATSLVVTLTVVLPPQIVVQPTNQMVLAGSNATFSVTATGNPPLAYQWSFNGTNLTDGPHITGSLTPALTISNAQRGDAGTYRVTVTNLYGVAVSSNAVLTVVPMCTPPPPGLIGWWKGDGNGLDSAGGNNAYAMPHINFTNGIVGQAFACDPENLLPGTYMGVRIADVPAYVLTNSLTLEGWIRVRGGAYSVFCRGDDRGGYDPYLMGTSANNVFGFSISDANGNYAIISTPLVYNQWYHVAGTLDGASGKLSLYTNGTIAAQMTTAVRPLGELIPARYPGVGIGNVCDDFNNFPFWGDIDELSLYDRALTLGEVQGIYNAFSAGKCLTAPPAITMPPTNLTVVVGSNAVFAVLAGGSPTLGYQWRFNGTTTLAATSSTLTIANVQLTNAGSYQVVVTNPYGSAFSAIVTLTVAAPPQIITQPTNRAVLVGTNTAFVVTATGTAPLSYQWWFNGTNALAATTATLSIPNPQLTNAGSYSVVVTNNYGQATSDVAYLSVAWPPSFKSIRLRYGTLVMTWNGATGFVYQLQYTTNLMQLDWRNVGFAIYALSNTIAGYDPIGSDPQRFYRVAIVP